MKRTLSLMLVALALTGLAATGFAEVRSTAYVSGMVGNGSLMVTAKDVANDRYTGPSATVWFSDPSSGTRFNASLGWRVSGVKIEALEQDHLVFTGRVMGYIAGRYCPVSYRVEVIADGEGGGFASVSILNGDRSIQSYGGALEGNVFCWICP